MFFSNSQVSLRTVIADAPDLVGPVVGNQHRAVG